MNFRLFFLILCGLLQFQNYNCKIGYDNLINELNSDGVTNIIKNMVIQEIDQTKDNINKNIEPTIVAAGLDPIEQIYSKKGYEEIEMKLCTTNVGYKYEVKNLTGLRGLEIDELVVQEFYLNEKLTKGEGSGYISFVFEKYPIQLKIDGKATGQCSYIKWNPDIDGYIQIINLQGILPFEMVVDTTSVDDPKIEPQVQTIQITYDRIEVDLGDNTLLNYLVEPLTNEILEEMKPAIETVISEGIGGLMQELFELALQD
ncbi:hypothetical protein PPERSA_01670 [Pseudocohnilembus persalinus]|uniref:Uncharacterized protein n=1 Tax=Pseudocohnilembus persalinus TaxID=266149 RepID=A0A0V0R179_PSEPJ|nr:hypothetical protein PPERSA_01670 [Pseudocohnilembus persalinus]|eukprot:KRX08125.1 hypothetical protein PPERSA_01670 [Pseudocohnilembus persalinus]